MICSSSSWNYLLSTDSGAGLRTGFCRPEFQVTQCKAGEYHAASYVVCNRQESRNSKKYHAVSLCMYNVHGIFLLLGFSMMPGIFASICTGENPSQLMEIKRNLQECKLKPYVNFKKLQTAIQ